MTVIGRIRSRAAGRHGAPPRLAGAALAVLLLSVPALAFALAPEVADSFDYDRTAIAAGESWRVITCHWTHWSLDHLAWDLAAFSVLVLIGWRISAKRLLLALALSAMLIPLAVWVALPGMSSYRGLSGIDSALFTLVAVTVLNEEITAGRRGMAIAIALVVTGFVGKIVFELMTGAALFADSARFVPVPLAHVVGGACGWVAAETPRPSRSKRHQCQAMMNRAVKSVVTASWR
jgi:rhomboid family GlyGly-CTERM serine protease